MGHSEGSISAEVAKLDALVSYQDGSVVSREIVSEPTGTVTLFAFDQGQGLSEHTASFDALVYVFEGKAEIIISGKPFNVEEGSAILMPANQPHALKAIDKFKMMLTMIKA